MGLWGLLNFSLAKEEEIPLLEGDRIAVFIDALPSAPNQPAFTTAVPPFIRNGEWKGSQSGVRQPLFVVFRSSSAWSGFWRKAIAPYAPGLRKVPFVDFSKKIVVGVFRGQMAYPTSGVEIVSIKNGRELLVEYREIDRFRGIFTKTHDTQPFHLKAIPLSFNRVKFLKTP